MTDDLSDEEFIAAIKYLGNTDEEMQLKAVQQDAWLIKDIDNPYETVQIAAVQQEAFSIYHIKNPSEAAQLAAVEKNGDAIFYIKNPTEKVQLASLECLFKYGNSILPRNITSQKAIDKWNKMQDMRKACE